MIVIQISYAHAPGGWFDMDYYAQQHLPMVLARVADQPGLLGVTVEADAGGEAPGSQAPEAAICRFTYTSRAAFDAAFAPHWAEIEADVPNYTNLAPVLAYYAPVSLPVAERTSKS
ncbi:EthD family reductase [Halothiobacillus sp. DCM-1]|uniref:EthD family reductase n=1 Tax=Halothiobacillus sp. DCM-1 TaxID=3112558 RepID=UPI003254E493